MTALRRRLTGDAGSAIIEFFFLGVLLLVPLVYVMLAVFSVQRAAFAVSAASREAGRAYATAPDLATARERALQAAAITMEDHDLDFSPEMLTFPDGSTFGRGDRVTLVLRYESPLPVLSAFFGDGDAPAIDVTGEHTATVDEFRDG